jgi:signal transduction histidine kinase/CheY-like chemotaxis protein
MRALFVIICAASVFTLLSLFLFAYVMYRESQVRVKTLVHLETVRLLEVQSELNRQLQLANLAKSDFLSSMSHELRTPLNAILGFAQLLEMDSPSPIQERSVGQILKAGWHLLALINEILDLSLIESGKMSLSLESVSLADVMLECQSMIEPQAQKRGIRVAFPQFDTPIFVKADRMRTKQVLINLLSNAIKYNTVDGKVSVDCATDHEGRVRISVSDTGAGLTPDKLNHLFQPFNRLGQEGLAEEGTGIGLVVCKRLTELMGGAIGVKSTVGKGCVFWIDLDSAEVPHAGAIGGIPAVAARPDAKLHTLLYVEDNPANLMLVEQLIERRPDFRLLTARDGQRGVEIARAGRPAVILMDINLPGISGIDALKILAEDPATAHIPVIALSASVMPRDVERGMEAGFVRYLTKPIKVPEFMDALDVALKIAQTHPAFANVAQIAVA